MSFNGDICCKLQCVINHSSTISRELTRLGFPQGSLCAKQVIVYSDINSENRSNYYITGLPHPASQMWPAPSFVSCCTEATSIHRIQCHITDSSNDSIRYDGSLARLYLVRNWYVRDNRQVHSKLALCTWRGHQQALRQLHGGVWTR